jgi:hypothetical protein
MRPTKRVKSSLATTYVDRLLTRRSNGWDDRARERHSWNQEKSASRAPVDPVVRHRYLHGLPMFQAVLLLVRYISQSSFLRS